ncbi:hypothetical protein BDN71DRAFT_1508647 [Pleurotus eryngii]|uniref:Uncharacterized protein n=1 Tax=Pleurotus eryngii TaxID=5323 RepID=A0A9P5ZTW1_PLEER|nr:hypothetical protein BDN71DRAFT_1508647 [Pleurotus eryngii]
MENVAYKRNGICVPSEHRTVPPIISELLKFTVAPSFQLASASFANLRPTVAANGVKERYYGTDMKSSSILLWVIRAYFPFFFEEFELTPDLRQNGTLIMARLSHQSSEVRSKLWTLTKRRKLVLPFARDSIPRPALTAPVCELHYFLHVDKTADKSLAYSLNKTFTDRYLADGFAGGHWSTATNDGDMNYYYLGWGSRAHYAAYSKTDLFALEVDKLMPYMDDGEPTSRS